MHLSQFPLMVNDIDNKDLIERCEKLNRNQYGEYQEKFRIITKEEFVNIFAFNSI